MGTDLRGKLFLHRDPYDIEGTHELFIAALKQNYAFQRDNCAEYRRILKKSGFKEKELLKDGDILSLPPIPTLYFKRNCLFSMPDKKLKIKATSSGTKGSSSLVGFDLRSLSYGIAMMIRFFSYHKVLSFVPVNYIVLGYQPSKNNTMGAAKTAYGTTKFAPALKRVYALKKDENGGYSTDIDGIINAVMEFSEKKFPVRFVGFPSYMYFIARELKERGVRLRLNKRSKILLGGGWKQFSGEEIDRRSFNELIEETIGIKPENCLEFYSAVEHPLPYIKCREGRFHVPIYSRAIIRDVRSLEPLEYDETGLLGFVSPLVMSMPLLSVLTDDMAIMHKDCACGNKAPCFELLGRAGISQIKTCAANAAELMGEKR